MASKKMESKPTQKANLATSPKDYRFGIRYDSQDIYSGHHSFRLFYFATGQITVLYDLADESIKETFTYTSGSRFAGKFAVLALLIDHLLAERHGNLQGRYSPQSYVIVSPTNALQFYRNSFILKDPLIRKIVTAFSDLRNMIFSGNLEKRCLDRKTDPSLTPIDPDDVYRFRSFQDQLNPIQLRRFYLESQETAGFAGHFFRIRHLSTSKYPADFLAREDRRLQQALTVLNNQSSFCGRTFDFYVKLLQGEKAVPERLAQMMLADFLLRAFIKGDIVRADLFERLPPPADVMEMILKSMRCLYHVPQFLRTSSEAGYFHKFANSQGYKSSILFGLFLLADAARAAKR